MTTSAERRFRCDPTLPSRARSWVRASLTHALPAHAAASVVDDAEIVVSELATNALRARSTGCAVRWDLDAALVTLSVFDDATGWPRPVTAAAEDQHGRGLHIVAALARRWGVSAERCGKRIWAQLAWRDAEKTPIAAGVLASGH